MSGVTIFIGYGIGVAGQWVWEYLQLPKPHGRTRRILVASLLGVIGLGTAVAVWRHVGWQNDVRAAIGMEPTGVLSWVEILIATTLVALLLLVIRRSIRKLFRFLARWLDRRLPHRLSRVLSGLALVLLLLFLFNGLLVRGLFAFANVSFSVADGGTPVGVDQPVSALRSGSPASLVPWESLGQWGRGFVGTGPTIEELRTFHGDEAMEPIRVYVGQSSADSLQERADLVL